MVETTKEFRTIMYSVVAGKVVTHRLPFNAKDAFGLQKLMVFQARGFTFDDPRVKTPTGIGLPEVIVTQEVDLEKPIIDTGVTLDEGAVAEETPAEDVPVLEVLQPKTLSRKKAARGLSRAKSRGRPRKNSKKEANGKKELRVGRELFEDGQVRDVQAIPKGMVRKITYLTARGEPGRTAKPH